jgi:hypothetical protein
MLFSAICDKMEDFVRAEFGAVGPVISRVPPDAYHITLVNRHHFDQEADVDKIQPISAGEHAQIERIVKDQRCGPVTVRYGGLLLMRSGRLAVPADPENDNIYRLKEALRDGVREVDGGVLVLSGNYPVQLFTKLGHMVTEPDSSYVESLGRWLAREGERLAVTVTFSDVFTQRGRVEL